MFFPPRVDLKPGQFSATCEGHEFSTTDRAEYIGHAVDYHETPKSAATAGRGRKPALTLKTRPQLTNQKDFPAGTWVYAPGTRVGQIWSRAGLGSVWIVFSDQSYIQRNTSDLIKIGYCDSEPLALDVAA